MAVTILSLNVKGLNTPYKWSMLWKEAKNAKVDIICAQETHFLAESAAKFRHSLFPQIFHSCSDKKKAGVLVAIKNSVQFNMVQLISDPRGRFLILVCHIDNVLCTIVNSYAPNSRKIAYLNKLWKKITKD